ncbi:uncharacterized protein [Misgurnus anguillicaudatus]|uniref:uncharacterized protein isoform X2 n=1 Tax=Misgurnus anguillicaudatus TaxID=75329 RepID=UPI003CCF67B4
MEWRIIFAVLCLFAASYVTAQNSSSSNATVSNATALNATGSNATAPNATSPNATAPNATAPNATAPNATAPNATAPNATAPNATAPNATAPNATAPNATAPNATAPNATAPNATAPNATAPNGTASANSTTPVELNLSFSIADTFKDVYNDMNAPDTVNLIKSITSQIEPVYKKRFPKFLRMLIKKFRSGSIVVDSALQFDSNSTTPNVTDVKQLLTDAAASGNLSIKISNDTINVTAPATPATPNVTTPNVTANTTTNGTSPNVTVAANSTTPLEFNLSFSIADTFKAVYNNMTDPETLSLIKNITTQIEPVYTKRFPKFLRMVIKKFSNGSILTDAALQFDSNGTIPNVTDVKQVLIDALANGNVTIKINNDTINVTAPATVTPVTPTNATNTTSNTALFTLVFSILENFNDTLSNLTSSDAISLQTKITNQFGNVFKKRHTNYLRMLIRKFSKGSIVTNSSLEFNSTGGTVGAQQVVDTIIEGIKNGNFSFTIDQKSIKVTDSSGFTVSSSSRVITSMLTVLLMSLASLLLSGVIRL